MPNPLPRPSSLFNRVAEWGDLDAFTAPGGPDSLRLGVLYGRRRQGKSEILQQLCDAIGGLYTLALEQHSKPLALQRFADALAQWASLPTGINFPNWENALETAVRIAGERATAQGRPQLIALDELPFLTDHSPELPGVLQWLYDTYGPTRGGGRPPVRLITCGSALSVMSDLLAEKKALYGRVMLNICLGAFDHVDAAAFWGIEDPETALRLNSVVGGIPGYKELTAASPVPQSPQDLDTWLTETILNPSHAMFDEVDLLFSQEPGIKDRSLYYGILAAIVSGESRSRCPGCRSSSAGAERLRAGRRRSRRTPRRSSARTSNPSRGTGRSHRSRHAPESRSAGPAPPPSPAASTARATSLTSCRCVLATCRAPARPG